MRAVARGIMRAVPPRVALSADRWPDHMRVTTFGALFLGFTMVANHIDFYSALLSHSPMKGPLYRDPSRSLPVPAGVSIWLGLGGLGRSYGAANGP